MTSSGAASTHAEQPQRARREPAPALETAPAEYAAPAPLFDAAVAAARPAADPPARPWQTAQRQAVAAGLGRRLGNRQLQRFVAAPANVAAPGPRQPETPARPAPAAEAPAAALTPAPAPRLQRGLWDTVTGAVADPRGAALSAIAGFARNLPGYTLLCLILGRDPIADRPVERNARTVVQAALGLVPGGNLLFENLNASGALDRAFGWLEEQWGQLGLTGSAITGLFRQAWDSISLTDFLNPAGVWERLKAIFLGPINRIRNFVVSAAQKVMEFIFEGVLGRLGGGQVLALLRQAGAAFQTIFRDPVRFLGNLLTAVRQGLTNFVGNIARHLQQGLMSWLLGALAQTGLQLPRTFDLASIFSLVMQVLGLTWQAIRSRAVRVLGERVVSALEGAFELFQIIRQRGLIGLWEVVRERLSELGSVVLNGIRELVITQVIQAGIRWVIGLLGGPAGAVIQAIQAIYNVITWITTNASRLAALVQAVAGSIQAIAAGALGAAAQRVEEALARTVPMVISFLASLLGLGDLGARVRQLIQRIRQPIERAIDWVIERARAAASRLRGALAGDQRRGAAAPAADEPDQRTAQQKQHDLDAALAESDRALRAPGATARQVEGQLPEIKARHRLTALTLVHNADGTYHVEGRVNPGGRSPDIALSAADAEWERAWRAKQEEVQAAMAAFVPRFQALAPDAQVHIRGSLATGVKLNPDDKKRVPAGQPHAGEPYVFNPTDFDIDAYVVSDQLYREAVRRSGETHAFLRGRIAGTRSGIPEVRAIIREMREALGRVTGNRDTGEQTWRFNVLIRSTRNAGVTTRRDRAAVTNLGLPAARGEPLAVQPPREEE